MYRKKPRKSPPRLSWRDLMALLQPVTRHPNRPVVRVGRVA